MPSPSIRNAITELEKNEQFRQMAAGCYLSAIRNIADYAIETEDETTESFRQALRALADRLEPGSPTAFFESRATLRALLRNYRDKASIHFNQLRDEFGRTAGALERLIETMSLGDGDHEERLRESLAALREISVQVNDTTIGPALAATADAIQQSIEQFREQQNLTVSQFLGEINLLHKRIDALETAVSVDDLTRVFDREETELRVREVTSPVSLLLLKAVGLRRAEVQFSPAVAQQLTAAFVKRLRHNLLPEAIVGCWSDEEFLVILPAAQREAMTAAKWLTEQLTGSYACVHAGKTVRPMIQVSVCIVECNSKEGAGSALERVRQFFQLRP
ncbi:MAG: GGDEF domain-containing protein [Acidobacteriia bacterium]|nr:GGDEF domain-containing protein [Terriglobia bacterium]